MACPEIFGVPGNRGRRVRSPKPCPAHGSGGRTREQDVEFANGGPIFGNAQRNSPGDVGVSGSITAAATGDEPIGPSFSPHER